jgi:hypothetical protein
MTWKTDWTQNEFYSYAQAQRLMGNYAALRDELNETHGFDVDFTPPTFDDYGADSDYTVLNAIEACLEALHVWDAPEWIDAPPPWTAAQPMPSCDDINRWERNGKIIERLSMQIVSARIYAGDIFAGDDIYYGG